MKSEGGAYLWGKLVIQGHIVWEYVCILNPNKIWEDKFLEYHIKL